MREQLILHIDMDAFYAAVEMRDDPRLKDKALVIGALPSERGVVATCNYKARKYGIRSAMNIKEAYNRCPGAVYMHPNFTKYRKVSAELYRIWSDYSDCIERISLDEAYLDVSEKLADFGEAMELARQIQSRTLRELRLGCSVGVGYSLMSAKLSSEEKKPLGLFGIRNRQELQELIIDRPVSVLHGVGRRTEAKLHSLGIHTVRDIYTFEANLLQIFKKQGEYIVRMAKGLDERQVLPYDENGAKSIGREHTFQEDVIDIDYLKDSLLLLSHEVAQKLQKKQKRAKTVSLKVSYANMHTITRAKSGRACERTSEIYKIASKLLDNIEHGAIRLIGVSVSNFDEEGFVQLSLSDLQEKREEESEDAAIEKRLEDLLIKNSHTLPKKV